MNTRRRWLAAVASLSVITAPAPSEAKEPPNPCADAAERGQVLRDDHKLLEARASFVACAQRECPAVVREACIQWVDEVDARLPSILVSAKTKDGRDVAGVRAYVNGSLLPSSVAVTAVPLDPGVYTIRCEADDLPPLEETVVLREGEKRRIVAFVFEPPASAPAPPPPPPSPPPTARSTSPLVYGLGAVGVVGLATFGILAGTGWADYERLERECAPSCPSGDLDALRTRFVVADIGLVVGLVSLGTAGVLAFTGRATGTSASR